MNSLALGQHFLPALEKLALRIPQLRCAMLCTPDGFNLCSLGLSENQVGKMAALSSSLLSVGDAAVSSLATPEAPATPMELMTMEADGLQIVCVKIERPDSYLILMASARSPLGVILMGVKATANDICKLL
ncbi:MAG: hypothetical protein KA803_13280 [Rhodoferax sp.]|nr:hypothetical protein [Rhodoferax sp.]